MKKKEIKDMSLSELTEDAKKKAREERILSTIALLLSIVALVLRIVIFLVK